MRIRPILLLLALCAPLLALAFRASAAARLGRAVVPTFEAVELDLDADRPGYEGRVRIELEVREPAASFGLHAEEMQIRKLELLGPGGPVPAAYEIGGELGLLTVSPREPLAPGRYTLSIDFSNDFGTRAVGLYRMAQDGKGYAFTQMEPDDAREAFPCWDEPEFKIPWQLTLVVPEAHTAVTNTPLQNESVHNGRRTMAFARSKPMPSYLIAIASGRLEAVPIPGMSVPGRVVVPAGQTGLAAEAVKLAPPLLAALERYFGRPYPYEKLDLIAVPEFWPGAMENPGAITFADRYLLLDPETASAEQRAGLIRVTAHELAHIWFGDLVTMAWWDDLWLNESFADWMADRIAQEVFPEYRYDVTQVEDIQRIMRSDARPSTPAIRTPVEGTENLLQEVGVAYGKGKSILGMFESWIGEERFRQGVLDYIAAHEWGNAVAADLWSALSKAAGKDLGAPMSTFLDASGLPLIRVEPLPDGTVRLGQERFLNHGVQAEPRLWQVPVTLKYFDGTSLKTQTLLLAEPSTTLRLEAAGPIAWIYPNAGERGYYRWTVPAPMLPALAAGAPKLLDVRERIGLLGNLQALLDAGAVTGDDYLRTLKAFAEDPEPLVIGALASSLGAVRQAFVTEDLEGPFTLYVRQTLGPALQRFGLERAEGEPVTLNLLRPQLMTWLGRWGKDKKVLDRARSLAKAYMADPASVDPALAEAAVHLAALHGDRALFDEYRRRFETTQLPADRGLYLEALGSFRDPALMDEALKYSLEGPMRPNEIMDIAIVQSDSERNQDRGFRWMTQNHAKIAARIPPMAASFLPYGAGGCSAERLEAARAFFAEPAHKAPGTDRSMAKVADQVSDCVSLRQREGKAVEAYLKGLKE